MFDDIKPIKQAQYENKNSTVVFEVALIKYNFKISKKMLPGDVE